MSTGTQATETWRPVAGYEGIYEVSDLGRVRGIDRVDAAGRRWRGRILRVYRNGNYATLRLSREGRGQTITVHTLVLEAFVCPKPDGMEACHNDGDSTNNVAANLRWDTHDANIKDAMRHGTHVTLSVTHCPRGHLLAEPNLVRSSANRGFRQCLACERARARARRAGGTQPDQAVADQCFRDIMRKT